MKKWVISGLLIMAAIFCAGWYSRPEAFVSESATHVVDEGDTIWRICGHYYYMQDRYKDYNEFVWETRRLNNLLGAKHIYPGDKIVVPLYKRKGVQEQWKIASW